MKKLIEAADLPIPPGAGQKIVPAPVFLTLIAFWQLIWVADWNEIKIRAAATYGPPQELIVDESVNICCFLVEYLRPGLAWMLPAAPEHDARYVTLGRP